MSLRKAVTFSGKPLPASVTRRSIQSSRVARVASKSRFHCWGVSLWVSRMGESCARVENFVRVGIADAAEDGGVGEGALQGAVLAGERGAEGLEVGGEHIDAARVDGEEIGFAAQDVEGGPTLGAGLGEDQGAVGKIEGGETLAASELGRRRSPVEPTGDHEVEHQPKIVVQADGDAFADAAEGSDGATLDG